ncbi:MAG: MBL fold metallo-hydrolase [Rhizobiales bacterium]|nr:MBL fold metallo-hydrolase [Hyphomicrobiales bacterium]NRB14929.1 MBL fold metallo-hydrolase [Hyphomicrobiales bacterium]
MGLKFTILGCGSSSGVPRITGDWGACDPDEPKNRRRRCAILVQKTNDNGTTTILIDVGADIHAQLLGLALPMLDAVLLTHEHADHTHGIDDLRAFAQDSRQQIPLYMTDQTFADVGQKFSYCFTQLEGSYYPAILKRIEMNYDQAFDIDGAGGSIHVLPVKVTHGAIDVAAFLIDGVMYSADVSDIPENSLYAFENLDIWLIDCLRPRPHVSHFGLDDSMEWIDKLRPARAILTNMTGELDYKTLKDQLALTNKNIIPAYDGMVFKT